MVDTTTLDEADEARPQSARRKKKQSTSTTADAQTSKIRAACDECRTKKLKCTGEQPACTRCVREGITCVYSPQKTMGRPKKRPRTDDGDETTETHAPSWDSVAAAPSLETTGLSHLGATQDAGFDSYLTPGGNLQPWLQATDWNVPSEGTLPGLTPDSLSSENHSPPTLNLPPELLALSTLTSHPMPAHNRTGSTSLLLDPTHTTSQQQQQSHLGIPPSALPSCACLSTLYLTLATLQSMDSSLPFPVALHPLREALQTASEVLSCAQCPTRFLSAVQNTQLVGTLLMSLAERFGKVLEALTSEAARAESEGEGKKFRLADLSTSTSHLHTGGLGCAAAFSIDLTPSEWRSMAKTVVRAEVLGPENGNSCCAYLMGLVERMESRQQHWHCDEEMAEDFPRDARGLKMGGGNIPREEHVCLKLCAFARKVVEGYDWS